MPRTIRRRVRVGPDRILHLQLPDDIEPGEVDVIVRESEQAPEVAVDRLGLNLSENARAALERFLDPHRKRPTAEEARKAADAIVGMFNDDHAFSLEAFYRERLEDDERRERHLMGFGNGE